MKKYLALIIYIIVVNSYSQELTIPTFTQYLGENPAIISPTYMGIGDYVKIRANGLTQWVGIKGAPDNQSLSIDGRLGQKSGLGAYFYNDKNGNTYQKGGKISFAHHLILDYEKDKYLSMGISYVLNKFEIDITKFDANNDPDITNNRSLTNHNFDLGLLYRVKSTDISLNVFNLLNKKADVFYGTEPLRLRNYSLYYSYVKKGKNSSIEYEPSAQIQYFEGDNRSVTDFNFKIRKIKFESYYWAGITYRFLNDQILKPLNIGPMVGMKKDKLYFAYSYQITTNDLIGYNTGTHMITIGIDVFQNLSDCPCTRRYTKLDPVVNPDSDKEPIK
jgi:type IX secretion system PorP/SprF family membrane protein